ncbi:TetR family transcriptional regulator [Amycolatopsis decaplanina]|uniref:TetR family transcriptional regulator n=1 Tax=Amycolatopsis decaplanina TaxID=208441 RepID=UPI001F4044BB|nr:TetR family transcriptional regulator [Amycolatopsis decaplanina]
MAQAGRRPGQTETREGILDAASRRFAEPGYDGATVRGIAADPGERRRSGRTADGVRSHHRA